LKTAVIARVVATASVVGVVHETAFMRTRARIEQIEKGARS
jgi:hypothetical protein